MGGFQIPGRGSGDDGFDEEGYDETQRAEILEATNDGPSDGTILVDMSPDLGDDSDRDEDDLEMLDDDFAEEDEDAEEDDASIVEDELQEDFEDEDESDDDELDDDDAVSDADQRALKP